MRTLRTRKRKSKTPARRSAAPTKRPHPAIAKLAAALKERKDALEQQTATASILKVISSSPGDIQPVFDAILENAMRLCDASLGTVGLYDGRRYRHVAQRGGSPEYVEFLFSGPFEPDARYTLGRMLAQRQPFHIADYREHPGYRERNPRSVATVELGETRTYLAVPMLKEGQVLGGITIRRTEVRAFTQKQIDLVSTFADQAVIAIENVRLFNEIKESLEQQTATADILKVISGSPTDVRPVFDAILKSAVALCGAELAATFPFDGKLVHLGATHNWSREALEYFSKVYPSPPSPQLLSGRTILTKAIVEISDAAADPHYDPNSVITGHWRRMLGAPMLREGQPLGALVVAWREPGETPRRQVELLQTFADQAAIAIANARLFNETKEALEQQTATADILRVIASSPASVQPVFDAILEKATDLCEAQLGALFLAGPEVWRMVSHRGASPEAQEAYREFRVGPNTGLGRMTRDRRPVHIEDLLADTATSQRDPLRVATIEKLGARTFLAVPLLKHGAVIGGVVIYRREVRPFGEAQIRLLSTFADQAVIAIENVRLFNETKEALEQQTAISEVLRVISNSPADVQPVLDAVAERAARICDAIDAQVFLREGDHMKHVARFGPMAIGVDMGDVRPLTRDWVAGQAVLEGKAIHIEDLLAVPREEYPLSHALRDRAGHRTLLSVPLMRERRGLGAISLRRMEVRPFTEKQITLVKTFADQAAIAIENARLFNETKEALEQQTATSEILRIISSSPSELTPVFAAILAKATSLCEAAYGILWLREGDAFTMAALHGALPADQWRTGMVVRPSPDVPLARVVQTRKSVHIVDMRDDDGYRSGAPLPVAAVEVAGMRTLLLVPMLKDSEVVGQVAIYRTEVRAFTERQIGLIEHFADQAVIAIENVRLFREIQEKSTQLEIANKHKSEFLANMSHELRTPLNAIIGFSEVLSERMFGEVNEKQAEYLKDIHESGRHLLSLINDILDLSKIEAGRMELELSSFHLPTALSNAMTLVRERAQRHGIQLGLEIEEQLGEVNADERKFKQIMLNLLSNAVKFTPDGGKVDVSARRANGAVEVAVCDTGIGIAPEDQALVFEEFRQVGRDGTRKAEGTGLGLALTKRFVELHGGAIRLDSTPGRGSTFSFTLPLHS
jgi:signal transduction histidine kinase/signal transduction protein with GAF and PtsI domain